MSYRTFHLNRCAHKWILHFNFLTVRSSETKLNFSALRGRICSIERRTTPWRGDRSINWVIFKSLTIISSTRFRWHRVPRQCLSKLIYRYTEITHNHFTDVFLCWQLLYSLSYVIVDYTSLFTNSFPCITKQRKRRKWYVSWRIVKLLINGSYMSTWMLLNVSYNSWKWIQAMLLYLNRIIRTCYVLMLLRNIFLYTFDVSILFLMLSALVFSSSEVKIR